MSIVKLPICSSSPSDSGLIGQMCDLGIGDIFKSPRKVLRVSSLRTTSQ